MSSASICDLGRGRASPRQLGRWVGSAGVHVAGDPYLPRDPGLVGERWGHHQLGGCPADADADPQQERLGALAERVVVAPPVGSDDDRDDAPLLPRCEHGDRCRRRTGDRSRRTEPSSDVTRTVTAGSRRTITSVPRSPSARVLPAGRQPRPNRMSAAASTAAVAQARRHRSRGNSVPIRSTGTTTVEPSAVTWARGGSWPRSHRGVPRSKK